MKKKILGLSFAILFFGSISAPTFAMTNNQTTTIAIVDHNKDNDKDKTKTKKGNSKECAAKSDCCTGAKAESCSGHKTKCCDDKKGGDKK